MTDFLVSQSNSAGLSASDWQTESFAPQRQSEQSDSSREINLREALEWLLGSPEAINDMHLSDEEKSTRKERRVDLLIWLMNLELRLSPYREPA